MNGTSRAARVVGGVEQAQVIVVTGLHPVKCTECGKTLGKYSPLATYEIVCPRCGSVMIGVVPVLGA